MEGSNTVIDNRPSVKVFYDCDHLSEADFVSVLLGIEVGNKVGGAGRHKFVDDGINAEVIDDAEIVDDV